MIKYKSFNSNIENIQKFFNKYSDVDTIFRTPTRKADLRVTPKILMDLFVERIDEGVSFQRAINKFELIDKEKFDNEEEYNEAVIKLVSELKILLNDESSKTFSLKIRFNDVEKWKKSLYYIVNESNKSVKNYLFNRFQSELTAAEEFKIQKIEEYNNKVANELITYDNKIKNKIAFLSEQAKIARKLDIKKGTKSNIDSKIVFIDKDQSLKLFDKDSDSYFYTGGNEYLYTRGYQALEEEKI